MRKRNSRIGRAGVDRREKNKLHISGLLNKEKVDIEDVKVDIQDRKVDFLQEEVIS